MDLTVASDWDTLDVEVEAPESEIPAVMTRIIDAEKTYLTKYCPSKLAPLIKEVEKQLGEKSAMAGGSLPAPALQASTVAVNQASGAAPPASIIDALVAGDDAALRKAMRATVAKKAFFFQLEVSKDPDRFPQSQPVFQLFERLGSAIGLPPADINGCWRAADNRIFTEKQAGLKIACQTQSHFTKQLVLVVQPDTSF
jgi:hypothetical protein